MRKKSLLRKFVLVFASYAITLSLPAGASAQSGGGDKITFDLKNAPLTEIFRQIETQTDKRIAYDDSILPGVRIDLAVRNESTAGVLDKALRNTGLTYQVKGKYVVIARKGERAAAISVSGRVADSAGPLVGATIIVKGSGTGTVTNEKGEYSLSNLSQDAVLVFSFVGMQTQEVTVGSRTRINVTMEADANQIEEVVVSYSSQKKTSLTASVGMIKNDKIYSKPVADVSSALVGQMAGLITAQSSGEVGVDKTEIYIRGISTFGNSSPLIVVDGVQRGDLSMLDANVIESVSVLKDAAAVAPYGMAGANGVILVTTKSGSKSRPTLTYNGYTGFQNPTVTPKLLNSYDYARMMNEAVRNADPKATLPYPNPEGYLKTIRRTADADYDRYPDSNAWDEIYNDNTVITSHNVGLSGGTDVVKYYMGLGYLYQEGMWSTSHMNKYNMLLNLEAKATRTTTIKLSFNGNLRRIKAPEATESHVMSYVLQYKPVDAFWYTNGLMGASNGKNPYGMTRTGKRQYEDTNIFTQLSVEQELPFVPGLKAKGVFSFDPTSVFQKTWHEPEMTYYTINTNVLPYAYNPVVSSEKPSLAESQSNSKAYTFQGMLTYANTFGGKHSVSALAVVEARQVDYRNLSASRTNFDLNIPELSMGNSNSSNWSNGGGSSKATQVGYVYRVSYEYDHKYLLETAGRYDGNYYFAKGRKFGFFPSVSAGWRMSEEPFIKNNLPWLNNLKLRASWGESGNLAGSPFQYSSAMNVYGGAYVFDGYLYQGVAESLEPNVNITWEKAQKTNVGIDIGVWNNRLTLEADYFYERRNNMLVSPQTVVPIEYGIGIAQENAGVMENSGVEFTLGGNYSFASGLRLEGSFNFTYARNKILQIFENPLTRDNPLRARTGRPLNTPFGLKAERLYQESDFDEYGNLWLDLPQPTFSDVAPGDIKWADLNGDGVIDGADETALGYPKLPQIIYGFTLKALFRGLDFSALFQGAGQSTTFIDGGLAFPFAGGENPPQAAKDYWTPENTDAAYPRLYGTGGGNSNNFRRGNNDWFRRSGNYLRLKNIELGYTFSRTMFPRLPLQSVRIYLSGQNLWTISDLKDFYDPEMGQVGDDANTRGWYSPQRKIVSVGLNITF